METNTLKEGESLQSSGFIQWYELAKAKDSIVYGRGNYAKDFFCYKTVMDFELDQKMLLTQRRTTKSTPAGFGASFDYIATKASPQE